MPTSRRPERDPFATPLWFKVWFAFCALLGLGLLSVIVWAVVTVVHHFTA